jgi:hypothetical protein
MEWHGEPLESKPERSPSVLNFDQIQTEPMAHILEDFKHFYGVLPNP